MGKNMLFATFTLFLLLSVTPLEANRVNKAAVQIQSHLVEGSKSESEWLFSSTKEQRCQRWQKDFEQRSTEMQTAASSLKDGAGAMSTVSTVMKLRSVTRIYQRAATAECEWVASREADTSALQSTVDENLAENPCFDQARVLLTHEWENAAEQTRAMTIATRMLMERTCESEDFDRMVAELDAGSADSDEEEADPQEELEVLAEESDEVADEFVAAVMSEEGASLLQTDAAAQFINTLQELVALVAFLLIWAILCIVFVPVILMVIGAVLCTLNWVLRRFLHHNANLGSCMNWWAHQTQTIFAPGNELLTAGACLIAGWLGALPHAHVYFPNLPRIYIRR